jgi:hypothetical protein
MLRGLQFLDSFGCLLHLVFITRITRGLGVIFWMPFGADNSEAWYDGVKVSMVRWERKSEFQEVAPL